ncbi:Cathepsin B-like cysteine proteinase [Giardia duodenalis]|uniref:Cathepsin B n=2 Tax=Giardia intestinalis TaxID=5741 RepID=C6LU60_GIAIB|nr:Cathepsin B precursor [Giardia intestinalis ATCC 50581]ESU43562.1 Cathepsin B-like cysteine proteinase [Giardia intestinalis]
MIRTSLLLIFAITWLGIGAGYYFASSMDRSAKLAQGLDPASSSLAYVSSDPHCERVHYIPPTGYTGTDTLVYDFREEHPPCSIPIRDQGLCSGSWAIAAVDMISMYQCANNLDKTIQLSPQYLLSCFSDTGCFGEDARSGFLFLADVGVPSEDCFPFNSSEHGVPPACPNTCVDNSFPSFTKITKAHAYGGNATNIAELLMQKGPLYTEMFVYKDLLTYHSGVYNRTSTDYIGTQAVILVGFGVDTTRNVSYWIARNSWGTSWGEDGFFRIIKGVNECGIENRVVYIDIDHNSDMGG